MRKYIKPILDIEDIEVTDIILESGVFGANPDVSIDPQNVFDGINIGDRRF